MANRYGRKVQLDEDIAAALKQAAEKEGKSMTEMANRILRAGIIPAK